MLTLSKRLSSSPTYRIQIIQVTIIITVKEEAEGSAFSYKRTCMLSPFLSEGLVGTVSIGATVLFQNTTLQVYNIHRAPRENGFLTLEHIFAAVSNSLSIFCGNLNT